jgi:Mu-like prophage major head subunit gpT
MTLTRAQALVLLEPKLSNIWHEAYPARPVEYTAYLNIRDTRKATVTDFKLSDFGPLRLKGEGENIIYDDPLFGNTIAYSPVRFALGYKITDEMVKHELYGQVEKFERALIASAIDLQETVGALVFNNGFGTTNADGFLSTGFDGLQLFSTAHTRLDGGTVIRNRPSADVDLSVTGLQNATVDFDNTVNDRGRPQKIEPRLLVINPEDKFTAREILQSEYKPGTANNEINALRAENLSFMVSHYITDADAWFLLGDQHDLNYIWEQRPEGAMEEDFDAMVIKRRIVEGMFVGHGEFRGTWGTSGG